MQSFALSISFVSVSSFEDLLLFTKEIITGKHFLSSILSEIFAGDQTFIQFVRLYQ